MKTYLQLVIIWCLFTPYWSGAQVNYGGVISTQNGTQLFQDAYNENAYYYLPKAPRLARLQDSTYQTALVKYIDIHEGFSGAYFSAILEYKLDNAEVQELEAELKAMNSKAFIKGQLPLFSFKEDPRYGNTSFKLVSSSFSNTNEMLNKVITSGQTPLQSGAKAAIMMELTRQGASLLEQSLLQTTSDINVLSTAYYPALSPSALVKISAPTQKLAAVFLRDFQQKVFAPEQVEELMQSQEMSQFLNIEIFNDQENTEKTAKVMELVQLFTEQVIPRFFEPVLGNCTGKESGGACLQLKKDPSLDRDSIKMVLQSKSIVKVPVIMATNIGGFIKKEADRSKYVKTVQLNKDFIGSMREVVVKLDEQYLQAFDQCLKGVAVRIKPDSSARPVELSFNWSEIENGQYKKEMKLRFQDPNDTLYYQVGWHFKQGDTTIVTPWIATPNPFITLVPPLEKRVIDLYFNGSEMAKVRKIIVEFSGRVGQKQTDKIISRVGLNNKGTFQSTSLTIFTDIASDLRFRPRWYFSGRGEFKQAPQLLKDNHSIFLDPIGVDN